ncbi:conserved protein of unknown function [Rhodovastum atsumiense]|uniref:SH3 domain-containing protein n=1 Tax=Rhodovastum atsumiense TaxID=504468 RepID=A0A5M6IVH0_9PROT|nr:hypothetical protein [Rhodovastum atsumiense]KAA5612313.1 hypothetical protein F1189_10450 [Rhodovastum atsumiense]CAH2601642.1 conserved protein of unknown function [Rhodovastum atsumiense]
MTDPNAPTTTDADFERLAARVGMLASEAGEADNAGRAVGALARRLGLTGGDLKRIFLAGAALVGHRPPNPQERERLEYELATLRQSLNLVESDIRRAMFERDAALLENQLLRARVERTRMLALGGGVIGVVALLMLVIGAVTVLLRPDLPPPRPAVERFAPDGALQVHTAHIRPIGASLFRDPDRAGVMLAVLPGGTRVTVRRLLWKALVQWAEVEAPGGRVGYVLTTEIDLS